MAFNTLSQKYLLVVISTLLFATCHADYDCEYDWEDGRWEGDDCDGVDLSTGAIIGISIAVFIIFVGVPMLLCFCCAWCCFRGRRNKGSTQVVVAAPVSQPQNPQYPYPQQQNATTTVIYPGGMTNQPPNAGWQTQQYNNPNPAFTNAAPGTATPYPVQGYVMYPYPNPNPNESNTLTASPPPPYYSSTSAHPNPAQVAQAPTLQQHAKTNPN